MTPEILHWLRTRALPRLMEKPRVLEIGSCNVNGSPRDVIGPAAENWLGIDRVAGPGVDCVANASDFLPQRASHQFDVIIATEVYEHDPRFWETDRLAKLHLAPDGIYIVTTPTTGFPFHSYGGDFYRFMPMAFEQVFFKGMSIIDISTVGKAPEFCLCGIARSTYGKWRPAVTQPPPTYAYTICDRQYLPWLPHWIHWHRDRFDKLFVLVRKPDADVEAMCEAAGVTILRPAEQRAYVTEDYCDLWSHAAQFGLGSYYAVIDVDEVFDIRYEPRALAQELQISGNIYCWFEMVNRTTVDGSLRPLPLDSADLFAAFPKDERFQGGERGANPWKPALRRCDMAGLHKLLHRPGRKWHDKRQFVLHHFDFCSEAKETATMKLAIVRSLGLRELSREYTTVTNTLNQMAPTA